MKIARYLFWRITLLIPLVIGAAFATFVLTHLLGNPTYLMEGSFATREAIQATTAKLGLDKPVYAQFAIYFGGLVHGDLGTSWFTGRAVTADLGQRFPATLELISLSVAFAIVVGIPLGFASALSRNRAPDTGIRLIAAVGVSMPEFWLGLILIFILYFKLRLVPAPLGQLAIDVTPPKTITGMYIVDSLLTGNWGAFSSSISQAVLPVITLGFVAAAPIIRQTRSATIAALESAYIRYANACGLPRRQVWRYALRNALPPVVTIGGILYGLLLGGAALVETVFSWGGFGQYAVQAMTNLDFPAIQGVILVSAAFSAVVYLIVDVLYVLIDPRVTY